MTEFRRKVLETAREQERRVAQLTSELVKFNTTAPNPGEDPFQDKECQEYIAGLLKGLGFELDLWEADLKGLEHFPFFLQGQSFRKRPQLAARLRGSGKGKSLILNAHIDVVPAKPGDWKHDPWGGTVEEGRVYGRGACDMKGGAAAIVAALETLAECDFKPAADIIVETVLDEEINGMGTVACIRRGYKADGAIIPEPSNLNIWVATRGIMWSKLSVRGKAGHAELYHPHWEEGGAVNAIEKTELVLKGVRALESEWRSKSTKRHPLLSAPRIIPTVFHGGNFWATVPDNCEVDMDIQYLPADRDERGYGTGVKQEIEEHISRVAGGDSWLRANPPKIEWLMDLPPIEIAADSPLVETILSASQLTGTRMAIKGLDSWYDGAHLKNLADTPSVAAGPGPIEKAHMIDEFVSVDTLRTTTEVIALSTLQWCGLDY